MMIKKILVFCFILFQSFNYSCRERFLLEDYDFQKNIVIDGLITDQPGPYTVKVSYSTNLNNSEFFPLSDCKVTVKDHTGNEVVFQEITPGRYMSSANNLIGYPGFSYKLTVETPEGEVYASDYETMLKPADIDSVYAKIENLPIEDEFISKLPGYTFYLNTEPVEKDSLFFLWKLVETYKYHSDFLIHSYIENHMIYEFYPRDKYYTCWKTEKVGEIFTGKLEGLNANQFIGKPLHFRGTETKKLQARYSLQTKQYVISRKAYNYWNSIEQIISGQSFFSSTQPFQIQGNIHNVENEEELVLGYFTVAPETSRRDFFERPDVDFYFEVCMTNDNIGRALGSAGPGPFYLLQNTSGNLEYAGVKCFDCRMHGGTLEKPEFWEEGMLDKTN